LRERPDAGVGWSGEPADPAKGAGHASGDERERSLAPSAKPAVHDFDDVLAPPEKASRARDQRDESGRAAPPANTAAPPPRIAPEAQAAGDGRTEGLPLSASVDPVAEWHAMVSRAAYFRAQRRGFVKGSPQQDWLEAEQELRGRRADRAPSGPRASEP
jgi:hypothetical protein